MAGRASPGVAIGAKLTTRDLGCWQYGPARKGVNGVAGVDNCLVRESPVRSSENRSIVMVTPSLATRSNPPVFATIDYKQRTSSPVRIVERCT